MIDFSNRRQLMQLLRNPDSIADLLTNETASGHSAAAIFADVFTVLRADTAALAQAHGIEMEVDKMSEDRAAELLASVVSGQGAELVAAFNREAERRNRILEEVMTDDEYERFMREKIAALETEADDEFNDEDLYADTEPIDVQSRIVEEDYDLDDGADEPDEGE